MHYNFNGNSEIYGKILVLVFYTVPSYYNNHKRSKKYQTVI